jgi:hypothetical protein
MQRMHRWEVGISRRAEGKQGRAFIGDMTEEKSVELASKLASEGFIFVVRLSSTRQRSLMIRLLQLMCCVQST